MNVVRPWEQLLICLCFVCYKTFILESLKNNSRCSFLNERAEENLVVNIKDDRVFLLANIIIM